MHHVTPALLLRYFGSKSAIARAYQVRKPSVSAWFRRDRVPVLRQYQLPDIMIAAASSGPRETGGVVVPAGQESNQADPDLTQPPNTHN